jgi:hypothetical protein
MPKQTGPTSEIGHAGLTTPPWGWFMPDVDDPPALQWPASNRTYNLMRSDGQIDALNKAVTLPVRKLKWQIAKNGARDFIVEEIAKALNLPIVGVAPEEVRRGRKRFDHDDHLRKALLAPTVWGHMPFEISGMIGPDGLWHMSHLQERMPTSLSEINVSRNGSLNYIRQWDTRSGPPAQGTMATLPFGPPPIPIQSLVMYVWEREGANWVGRSMLRPLYKHWILKDRLLRIDALKHERFGLGIPYGQAPAGGKPGEYQALISEVYAADKGAVGLPDGAKVGIQGITGTLPDTLASIQYQDEQMARTFLAMFMQLGTTQTGSRALGETFADVFSESLAAFANWYAKTTNEFMIEDYVDWNWGEDEAAPLLVWEETDEAPLSAMELAQMTRDGALVVDAELQQWIRNRFNMPDYKGGTPLPTKPATPAQEAAPVGNESVAAHLGDQHDQSTHGNRQKKEGTPVITTENGLASDIRESWDRAAKAKMSASSQTLSSGQVGHRAPNEVEVAAATDFTSIQQSWQMTTDSLVTAWAAVQAGQIDALVESVAAAAESSDLAAMASLSAPVDGEDVIYDQMLTACEEAIAAARAEAVAQGVEIPEVAASEYTGLIRSRAHAISVLMARALADTAARQAISRYGTEGLPADEIAAGVRSHLEELSDAYLQDQLGGAITQAQNSGRRVVMSKKPARIYASELLDLNTCSACRGKDGTEYPGLIDAEADYPTGGYRECAGGARCRGTLVAVYNAEG